MIKYSRKDKTVKIAIDIRVPNYEFREIWAYWDCNSEIFAGLLSHELQKQQDDAIVKAKEEAYLEGYRDGRGKKKKRAWFNRIF